MDSRTFWLFLGLVGAAGALFYYEYSQGAQDALSNADDGSGDGGIISSLENIGVNTIGQLSRGFRNNNPGNIRGSDGFNGQTGVDSDGFATFDTMQDGIRAIAVILKNYQSLYGLNTVRALISRWSATDQAAYIADVAADLGVDPDDSINVADPNTLNGLVSAIITQENGQVIAATLPSSTITNAVALA